MSTDPVTQQLFIRATAEQQQQIRDLLIKMGETGLALLRGRSSQNMRTVPFQGDAKAALEEIRRIWPKLRDNEIRVVSPDQPLPPQKPADRASQKPSPPTSPRPNQPSHLSPPSSPRWFNGFCPLLPAHLHHLHPPHRQRAPRRPRPRRPEQGPPQFRRIPRRQTRRRARPAP